MKKVVHWILGVILSFAVIMVLLISSFQAAMYMDFSFYEKEYEKYDVLSDLNMKMEDVMYVTHEMMDYLKGDRENLEVITTVEGKEQDFFNEQDKLHMADVQGLFIGGLNLRMGSLIVLIVCLVLLILTKGNWKYIIPRAFQIALGISGAAAAILAFLFSRDFTAAFTKFHEIFFTNDLWIFDPATDYMIRMLPEGLFFDFVIRIGGIFAAGLILLLICSVIWRKNTKINNANE
ncbi:TIGR01906 family membrane protein [Faecalicatena contorta]|uniref:Integral membrane protein TIGR01906 n=1 Tax=Faecalicatena contorta TaxID=39482 RepID=A0A316A018_9FIRM|nr:TIGR01906 family membrane protein [Faecalicatena contorta]PWJ50879.1 integral membrane protein (TIGR01906 family) [Faecalicatena contorta]SUQ13447.1 integral membrane protein TIGR01906 [Faecalicatena contorta]